MDDAAPMSAFDLRERATRDDLPAPRAEGDLRETFNLPLTSGRDVERGQVDSGRDIADAASLLTDRGRSERRLRGAEARARGRRCAHCGGAVPQGMSICVTCGTDQDTGQRVGFDDDLVPLPPPTAEGPPLHVSIIGGLCSAGSVAMLVLAVIASTRSESGLEQSAWLGLALVAIFSIFASIQFIRGKSAKQLIAALTLGVVIDVMALIALPILQANFQDQDKIVTRTRPQDPEESNVVIKPLEERIDTARIALGVVLIFVYALLSMYLISPSVHRYIHPPADRGP
jgi:hypothetical protein